MLASTVWLLTATGCAEGYSAEAWTAAAGSGASSTLLPSVGGGPAGLGPSASAQQAGAAGANGARAVTPGLAASSGSAANTSSGAAAGAGGAADPACRNLVCIDIFDCVFVYLGNSCGFTECTGGVCR